jgi:16S rRNA (adenine1518-N6/adenine1519-N6)-dimethyltransferase
VERRRRSFAAGALRPRKRFGQHFLEPAWVRKVVDAIAPAADDVFLEIGPGRGALTSPLAERSRLVVAVEVDRDLAAALPSRVPANVRVLTGDVLATDLGAVVAEAAGGGPVRVAGNLPYNISTPILFALLDLRARAPQVRDATLMLQKEVVDRLAASPGGGDYGVLAVLVQRLARVERVLTLPPGAFRPPPEVTSAVVRLTFLDPADVLAVPDRFVSLVRTLFTRRRKTMANSLAAALQESSAAAGARLEGIGIDPKRRPETLSLAEFAAVARAADSPAS